MITTPQLSITEQQYSDIMPTLKPESYSKGAGNQIASYLACTRKPLFLNLSHIVKASTKRCICKAEDASKNYAGEPPEGDAIEGARHGCAMQVASPGLSSFLSLPPPTR